MTQGCHPELAHLSYREVYARFKVAKRLYNDRVDAVGLMGLTFKELNSLKSNISFFQTELSEPYRKMEEMEYLRVNNESPF